MPAITAGARIAGIAKRSLRELHYHRFALSTEKKVSSSLLPSVFFPISLPFLFLGTRQLLFEARSLEGVVHRKKLGATRGIMRSLFEMEIIGRPRGDVRRKKGW